MDRWEYQTAHARREGWQDLGCVSRHAIAHRQSHELILHWYKNLLAYRMRWGRKLDGY